ncbi:MAG: GNAT family N-acetyltransferase [Oscillospiraceae bacterium]|nr:GNAT family N-acetyltransferase [Oscillospiraceae bacterium]
MENIRKAEERDFERIAEIEIFNYRLNFYPIFRNDEFYFGELSVSKKAEEYRKNPEGFFVYDDGTVKGFVFVSGKQINKLFVEPVLQGNSIGAKLLDFAVSEMKADFLWALEKNKKAIAFYERNGFHPSGERKPEEDTSEYLVKMIK